MAPDIPRRNGLGRGCCRTCGGANSDDTTAERAYVCTVEMHAQGLIHTRSGKISKQGRTADVTDSPPDLTFASHRLYPTKVPLYSATDAEYSGYCCVPRSCMYVCRASSTAAGVHKVKKKKTAEHRERGGESSHGGFVRGILFANGCGHKTLRGCS